MKKLPALILALAALLLVWSMAATAVKAQSPASSEELDARVQGFLDSMRDRWRDLNVPYQDG